MIDKRKTLAECEVGSVVKMIGFDVLIVSKLDGMVKIKIIPTKNA